MKQFAFSLFLFLSLAVAVGLAQGGGGGGEVVEAAPAPVREVPVATPEEARTAVAAALQPELWAAAPARPAQPVPR